jgi:F-type H+-transporting ATPase subunit b
MTEVRTIDPNSALVNPDAPAHEQQGMPETGVHATTAAQADVPAGEHHVDPSALGLNATAWVALAMLVVIGIMVWKKVPAAISRALDKKIAAIREQLDEAKQLRAEAEALKAEYEAKAAQAGEEARVMVERARHEADGIVEQARTDAVALVERRARMAEDKIGAAERAALDEVRAKAADMATAAAAQLIAQQHDEKADRAMIDRTIADLGTRLN